MSGIPRSPYPSADFELTSVSDQDSVVTYDTIVEHETWVREYLGLGGEEPFKVTAKALEKRRQQFAASQEAAYATTRDAHQISMMLGGTVSQIEDEMRRRTVLDIGCGQGRFGEAMARKAKSEMTFVDIDEQMLARISRKAGNIVLANAADLPFDDETFDRTLSVYAAISWSETPQDAIRALNEAVRVTEVGGSTFIMPAFSHITSRKRMVARSEANPIDVDHPLAHQMVALQDHLVFTALERFREEGGADITWRSLIGQGVASGGQVESLSAIIDKTEPMGPELLEQNLAYAEEFTA